MEVLVGSALGIEVSSASAFVRERTGAAAQAGDDSETGFGAGRSAKSEEEEDNSSSAKSSSIGVPDDSDEEEEDGVVSSEDAKGGLRKGGLGSFGSLASLEDSLPIKRGLSNHFSGKSKSFSNLSEANLAEAVSSARDLEKPEHPFNKKRRILRWSKNFSLLPTAKSMPLFPLSEEDDDAPDHREGDDDDGGSGDEYGYGDGDGDGDGARGKAVAVRHGRKHSVFKSSSCFALSDLHEEDEDEEDEDDGGGN